MRSTLILFAVGTAIACVSAGGYGGGYGMNVGYGGIGGYGQSNYLGNTGYYQYMHQKPMYYALQPQVVTYGQGSGSGNLFGGGGSGGSGNLFGGGGYGNVYGGGVGGGSDLGAIIPIIIICKHFQKLMLQYNISLFPSVVNLPNVIRCVNSLKTVSLQTCVCLG